MGSKNKVKTSLPYLDSIDLKEVSEKTFYILGNMEDGSSCILARVGEGASDFRTVESLKQAVQSVADVLYRGYRTNWLIQNGMAQNAAWISIEYDEGDPEIETSYRGVMVSISSPKKQFNKLFYSGDPTVDWQQACKYTSRNSSSARTASSVQHFCMDVKGFAWDDNDNIISKEAKIIPKI